MFALGPDDESDTQEGYHLCLTLPPGTSRFTSCRLEVLALTGDYYEPYARTGVEQTISGSEEVAVLSIANPYSQAIRSTIYVNGREVSKRVYSLYDGLDHPIHQLTLSELTVTGATA